jgi:peroxiredoxin
MSTRLHNWVAAYSATARNLVLHSGECSQMPLLRLGLSRAAELAAPKLVLRPCVTPEGVVAKNSIRGADEMSGFLRAAFVLVLAGILFIRYSWQPVPAALKSVGDRKTAPEFTLRDADGNEVKLADYKGNAVLLNFWATWCGPCKIEIPWFMDFEKKYRDQGFAVLGVSMDEDGWKVVKPYLERMSMNYRVLLGNDGVAKLYGGIDSLPTTLLIDRTGKIAQIHSGLVSKSTYEGEIQELLRRQ